MMTPTAVAMQRTVGTAAGACQFAETVRMSLCTGAYLGAVGGNGWVISAAHCDLLNAPTEEWHPVYFGENGNPGAAARTFEVVECIEHPGWIGPETGVDIELCKLRPDAMGRAPITPPILPMVPGTCESAWLSTVTGPQTSGIGLTITGMGLEDAADTSGPDGIKRYVHPTHPAKPRLTSQNTASDTGTKLNGVSAATPRVAFINSGDSGGPWYVQMVDQTYRLVGVTHSTAGIAGFTAEAVPPYLPWIESETGLDLTPCHDRVNNSYRWIGGMSCLNRHVKNPLLAGRSWAQGDCAPAFSQFRSFFGGGAGVNAECAGWAPIPIGVGGLSARGAVTDEASVELAVAAIELGQALGLPGLRTCEDVAAAADALTLDSAHDLFLETTPRPGEQQVASVMEASECSP